MKKFFPLFLVLMISTLAGCCAHVKTGGLGSHPTVIDSIDDKTVALVIKDFEGDTLPYCTGVWVDTDMILTAHHCVAAAVEISQDTGIVFGEGEEELPKETVVVDELGFQISYILKDEVTGMYQQPSGQHESIVVAIDPAHDLALVKALHVVPSHLVAELAEEVPVVGSPLHIVGHVKGLYWTYVPGTISAERADGWLYDSDKSGPFIQVSSPVYKGNSGGGAFTTDGRLLGIASFIVGAPNTAFFIHLDSIRSFLALNDVVR